MKLPLSANMTNEEIALVFEFIGQVLKLKEENIFRIRAYENAASTLKHLEEDIFLLIEKEQDLTKLPGIGQTIADKLIELNQTGDIQAFTKMVKDLPQSMWQLTQIHSIGPKKAFRLATFFQLDQSLDPIKELIHQAKLGKVSQLDGFGKKSQSELLEALTRQTQKQSRISYKDAKKIADRLLKEIQDCNQVVRVEPLGSLRRKEKTIGDLDFGVIIKNLELAKSCLERLPSVKYVLSSGDNMISLQTQEQVQVDIKISQEEEWGSFLQHFTGSKTHNILLRKHSLGLGYSLSEHGIKDIDKPDIIHKFVDERKFYQFLGLELIPPQERNGATELEKYKLK